MSADLSPVLGDLWREIPSNGMSSVDEDLRTLLGEHLPSQFSRIYCGNGNLSTCRSSMWDALHQAVQTLTAQQGPDPTSWRLADHRISFTPGLLANTISYTNRPTFQKVVSFGG